MNIDFTLWPNPNGELGKNKVAIPDGVNTFWPEGDALVGNFVYKDDDLVDFVDTKALIVNDSKSTTFPYDYVNIQVDKSLEGVMTFNKGERTKYFTISYSFGSNADSGDVTYTELESISLTPADFINTQLVPPADLLFRIDYQFNEDSPIDDDHVMMQFIGEEDMFETQGVQGYQIRSNYLPYLHPAALGLSTTGMIPVDYERHTMVRFPHSLETSYIAGRACLYLEEGEEPYPQFGYLTFDYEASTFNNLLSSNSSPTPTLLFNNKGDNTISGCSINYYSIKLYSGTYDDSSLIADMRPVQSSNGETGLYDYVRNIFLPIQTATQEATAAYSLRNNSPTIEEIINAIAEEKGISVDNSKA